MIGFTYVISDIQGLHARNALQLARAAEGYQCRIRISKGEKQADGKQVLSLMALNACCGDTLEFQLSGEDEQEAAAYLQALAKEIL